MAARKTREPVSNHPTPTPPSKAETAATQAMNEALDEVLMSPPQLRDPPSRSPTPVIPFYAFTTPHLRLNLRRPIRPTRRGGTRKKSTKKSRRNVQAPGMLRRENLVLCRDEKRECDVCNTRRGCSWLLVFLKTNLLGPKRLTHHHARALVKSGKIPVGLGKVASRTDSHGWHYPLGVSSSTCDVLISHWGIFGTVPFRRIVHNEQSKTQKCTVARYRRWLVGVCMYHLLHREGLINAA